MLVKKPDRVLYPMSMDGDSQFAIAERDYYKACAEFAIDALQKEAEYDYIGSPINDAARAINTLKDNE